MQLGMKRFREIAFTRWLPRPLIRDGMTLLILVVTAWLLAQWFYSAPRDASFTIDVLPAVLPRAGLYDLDLRLYDTDDTTDITTTGSGGEGIFVRNARSVVLYNEADITAASDNAIELRSSDMTIIRNSGTLSAGQSRREDPLDAGSRWVSAEIRSHHHRQEA